MISRFPIFSVSINKRQVLAFYNHWICGFNLLDNKVTSYNPNRGISIVRINEDNIGDCLLQTDFYVGRMKNYLHNQSEYTDGFLFYKNNVPVGFIWVMYPGGNEFQYRVRRSQAFIFDVCVYKEYRGQGLCGEFMSLVFKYLKEEKGLIEVKLAVRKNNINAIRAYKKAGARIVGSCRFIQIARKYNIPYHKV